MRRRHQLPVLPAPASLEVRLLLFPLSSSVSPTEVDANHHGRLCLPTGGGLNTVGRVSLVRLFVGALVKLGEENLCYLQPSSAKGSRMFVPGLS